MVPALGAKSRRPHRPTGSGAPRARATAAVAWRLWQRPSWQRGWLTRFRRGFRDLVVCADPGPVPPGRDEDSVAEIGLNPQTGAGGQDPVESMCAKHEMMPCAVEWT